jgi:membrane protease YdiL (CAAX protease family)
MQQSTFKDRNPVIVLIWTFALFILMQISQYVGILLASLLSGASFEAIIEGEFNNHYCVLGMGLAAVVIGIPLTLVITKYLWRRSWKWMCFTLNPRLFGYGILLGIALPLLIIVIISALGTVAVVATPARFTAIELLSIVFGTVCLMTYIAITEELIFRGMVVREWAVKMDWPLAALIGGLYFGAVHIFPFLSQVSPFQGVWIMISGLVAGMLFVVMYIRSKSLWLPIGFHFGWNLCLQLFLGTTLSGQEANFGLFRTELSGPLFLTGGEFGIESSVVTYFVYGVVAIFILKYSRGGRPELLNAKPETDMVCSSH